LIGFEGFNVDFPSLTNTLRCATLIHSGIKALRYKSEVDEKGLGNVERDYGEDATLLTGHLQPSKWREGTESLVEDWGRTSES
jgi:hypothetical protein